MADMKEEVERIASEVGVEPRPVLDPVWMRSVFGAVAAVLLAGVYSFSSAGIPTASQQDAAPSPSNAAGEILGGDGTASVAEVIPAAEARRLANAMDRGCAAVRDADSDPAVIHAGMTSAQSLRDGSSSPISLADVESGLAELRQLCDDTDRLLEIDSFIAEVQRDLGYLEERIDRVRPECGPPVRMNWQAEVRKVGYLLEELTDATGRMAGGADEVERLRDEVLVRIRAMSTSVDYYEQFAEDICAAHDLVKRDLEAEDRHRRLLADAAAGLFRNGWEGFDDKRLTAAVDRFHLAFSQFYPSNHKCCGYDSPSNHKCCGYDSAAHWKDIFATRRMIGDGDPPPRRSQRRFHFVNFRWWDDRTYALAAILVPPAKDRAYRPDAVGYGGDKKVVKHYLTIEKARVVVGQVEKPIEHTDMVSRYTGFRAVEEFAGVRVNGNDVFIRHAWGPRAAKRGSHRPLVDYLERIRPFVQKAVDEECVDDFLNAERRLTLEARFGASLRRLDPSLSQDDREMLFSVFREAMKTLQGAAGIIARVCSAESATVGVEHMAQLLENAHGKVLSSSAGESEQGGGRITLVTDPSARHLQRFDRAWYVGRALMEEIQIDKILSTVNVNGEMVEVFTAAVAKMLEGAQLELDGADLETVLELFRDYDKGPIGVAREKYQSEYEDKLAELQVQEGELRLLEINNKHDMAMLLEENRGKLETAQLETRATIVQARENARATVAAARIDAQARVAAARAAQQRKPGFFDLLLSTVGGLVGTAVGGPLVGVVSGKLTSLIAPAPEPQVTTTARTTTVNTDGKETITTVNETVTAPPAPPGGAGR